MSEKFLFSKGDYTITIYANDQAEADHAWATLQSRNYYPTDKKWYVSTNSTKPSRYNDEKS